VIWLQKKDLGLDRDMFGSLDFSLSVQVICCSFSVATEVEATGMAA